MHSKHCEGFATSLLLSSCEWVKVAQSVWLFGIPWTIYIVHGELYSSPGQNTGVGSLSLLQGILPIQGLNPGLPHFRQTLYQLSHQGSPEFLYSYLITLHVFCSCSFSSTLFPPTFCTLNLCPWLSVLH